MSDLLPHKSTVESFVKLFVVILSLHCRHTVVTLSHKFIVKFIIMRCSKFAIIKCDKPATMRCDKSAIIKCDRFVTSIENYVENQTSF